MNIKILNALISVFLSIMLLFSCESPDSNGNDTTQDGSENNSKILSIVQNGISEYAIARGENATAKETASAVALKKAILNYTGVELRMTDDFLMPGASAPDKEILVGSTSRDESKSTQALLKSKDYTIRIVGEKLVITGGEDTGTEEAVNKFIADYLSGDKKTELKFSGKSSYTYSAEYPADALTINGIDISKFQIVYSSKANNSVKTAAKYLSDKISDICGVRLKTAADNTGASEYEIIVGKTTRSEAPVKFDLSKENSAAFAFADGKLFLAGNNVYSTRYAVEKFSSEYVRADMIKNKKIELKVDNILMEDIKPVYSAMSFNILYSISQTPHRKQLVIDTILNYMPDSVGVQECSVEWMNILKPALSQYYDCVGELNNKTQKWYNAVFYRKDKFKLIETKTVWLSATPSFESKLEASTQFRTVTHAVLEDIATGSRYAHYNTHVDYNEDARPVQLNILIKQLEKTDLPIVLTGDFNFAQSSSFYNTLVATKMKDSKFATDNTMDASTLNSFGTGSGIIDFCYVTLDSINVSKYRVVNTLINNQYSSDHFPVYIEFSLSK